MAYSKEIPAYPDIEYLLLTCFCPLRTTAIGRKGPTTTENGQGLTFAQASEPKLSSFPALLPVEELWSVRRPCISCL